MPKPMRQWLDYPRNRVMFEEIWSQLTLGKSQGKFNDTKGNLEPDKMESERNQRRLSLTEQLIQEAPNEYLREEEIEDRRSLQESDTPIGLEARYL